MFFGSAAELRIDYHRARKFEPDNGDNVVYNRDAQRAKTCCILSVLSGSAVKKTLSELLFVITTAVRPEIYLPSDKAGHKILR